MCKVSSYVHSAGGRELIRRDVSFLHAPPYRLSLNEAPGIFLEPHMPVAGCWPACMLQCTADEGPPAACIHPSIQRPLHAGRDFWYEFVPGERIGVVGPNGAGKSTLLAAVAGKLELAAGERDPGETTAIGWFTQEPISIPEDMSMTAYLRCRLHRRHPKSPARHWRAAVTCAAWGQPSPGATGAAVTCA